MNDMASPVPPQVGAGHPLAAWTYNSVELLDLEYEAFFLRRWQFAGHVSQLPDAGDYLTKDLGRDNVVVVRGKDNQLRAFINVCRHRASRLLDGSGRCRGAIRCRYHGWTYALDGTLKGVPDEQNFPGLDKAGLGLRQIELEVFHGLLFIRLLSGGPSVSQSFGDSAAYFEGHGVADYEPIGQTTEELWQVNWKVAWDNYLENYHIPVGHPGLQRLLNVSEEAVELDSGVSMGVFTMREKLSDDPDERAYQQQLHHSNYRLPEALQSKWVQFGYTPNLGLDLYPELLDLFEVTPLDVNLTRVTMRYFGHRNPTPKDRLLRRLNLKINQPVNEEDRQLCERVQLGLKTTDYVPGPLSQIESSVSCFHHMIRTLLPVASLQQSPPPGQIAQENQRLLDAGE